ncbi:hypothetical protein [Dactylosporangium sp. NPDC048998]
MTDPERGGWAGRPQTRPTDRAMPLLRALDGDWVVPVPFAGGRRGERA